MRDYEFYYTQDGSIGLYSYTDNDVYHSKFGALTESWEKFIEPSGLENLINTKKIIKVLDVCYGIGYNTKSLMSFIINNNEKFFEKENKFKKILKIIKKYKEKFSIKNNNIDSIDNNNTITVLNKTLSESIESINADKFIEELQKNSTNKNDSEFILSNYEIDCLDINEELVKISPLLKTIITPQEIFLRIVPKCFDCFEWYWKIVNFLSKIALKFAPKNKREIKELLDLKFNNDYDFLNKDYRIHKFVNFILLDTLIEYFRDNFFSQDIKKMLSDKRIFKFFDNNVLKYAHFKQMPGYNIISKFNLFAFLHNIYYDHLSNRYKRMGFKDIERLFKLNFYIGDARKTILKLKGQYDLIFLDAFTFSKAPELWTVEFMAELYDLLSPNGILMTYSNSALVRNTFLASNFYIGKIYNKKTGKYTGTIAAKDKSMIKYPLNNYEIGLCSTKAGIPYRDPNLNRTKEQILKHREIEFKSSDLPTSSQYMRQRGYK